MLKLPHNILIMCRFSKLLRLNLRGGRMQNRIYFKKFLSEDDFQYYLDLVSNEEVMVMNYGRAFTLEESNLTYKSMLKNNKNSEAFGYFKVFEKGTNVFIGSGAITLNNDFTEAEIEYMLMPDYWGKGYGSEIVRNLLKKAEETKVIHKVIAITDPNNLVSKKILFNNGFVSCKIFEIDDGSLAEMHSKEIIHL